MSDRAEGGLVWDTSDVRTQSCTLVTTAATADTVVLSFGNRETDYSEGHAAMRLRLTRRIALRPASARHLRDLLGQVVAEMAKPAGQDGS